MLIPPYIPASNINQMWQRSLCRIVKITSIFCNSKAQSHSLVFFKKECKILLSWQNVLKCKYCLITLEDSPSRAQRAKKLENIKPHSIS